MISAIQEAELKQWRAAWTRGGRADSTVRQYVRDVRKYLDWCESRGQESASLASANEWLDQIIRDVSSTRARQSARALKAYGKFIYDELEGTDHFRKVKLPREDEPSNVPTATEEDLHKLLDHCAHPRRHWEGKRDAAILLTLAFTGMRRSECASIRRADLDLMQGHVTLRKTKSGTNRTVALPNDAVKAILSYLRALDEALWVRGITEKPEYLWVNHYLEAGPKPLTANGLGQMIARRAKEVGVDARAHAFRRQHAETWLLRGGSETALMTNSGWKSPAMVARYTKKNRERIAHEEARRIFGD